MASGGRSARLSGRTPRARGALVALLCALQAPIAWNAVRHDPRIGYDAERHLAYAHVLSNGRLPGPRDTTQFYSPPLPYLVPAAAIALADASRETAAKVAQLFQVLLSIATALALLALCERVRPGDVALKAIALLLCALPAVYPRTFAQVRGEPYVTALAAVAAVQLVDLVAARRPRPSAAALFGAVCGLLALSRQLGAVLAVAALAFAVVIGLRMRALRLLACGALAAAVAAAVGGWFYVAAATRTGRPLAFNKQPHETSLRELSEVHELGVGWPAIVRSPGRPEFQTQPLAILYADWWGDYFYYFLFRGRDPAGNCLAGGLLGDWAARGIPPELDTNHAEMAAYLGRWNAIALTPSLLCAAGIALGCRRLAAALVRADAAARTIALAFAVVVVAASVVAVVALVVRFGVGLDRDSFKASYLLPCAPFLALLGGEAARVLAARSAIAGRVAVAALVGAALYGAAATVTRWPMPLACTPPWWDRPPAARVVGPGSAAR